MLVFGAIFLTVTAALAVGYLLFLRPGYTPLFTDLRAQDASAIVAELDKRGIKHRLEDSGATIAVPADIADDTRVALAGSDLSERGVVGFELFNKSDMGLTNFAQKINYQRALQGELARTIMTIDGVDSARVHLAMPERTLFSDRREDPKAAVSVVTKPGATLDPAQVAGIQQLVAAAVPDLPTSKVVVLDEAGRIVSADNLAETDRPADIEEQNAIEHYYRARARAAIEAAVPGMGFSLRLIVSPTTSTISAMPVAEAPADVAAETGAATPGDGRNVALRIVFVSPSALNADDQAMVRRAIEQAVGFDAPRGDTLSFEVGPLDGAQAPPTPAATARSQSWPVATHQAANGRGAGFWPWIAGALLLIVLAVWRLGARNGATRLSAADHEAFAERLSRRIAIDLEGGDATA